MPLIATSYVSPQWLRNGHVQTILPVLLPRRLQQWQQQERLELADGDFLDLCWLRTGHPRLAVLSHGLEGSTEANYMRGMAGTLHLAGWDVLGWNFRSCGGIENRLMRSYHSGESGDLRLIIDHAAQQYKKIVLVGFSLGGNISLKCVGEAAAHAAVVAAVAISAPVDLASCARVLDDNPANRLYLKRFLKTLKGKTQAKAIRFPELHDMLSGPDSADAVQTIREFDQRITAPVHGFASAEDYWARASALPHLAQIQVPSLLLSARNDPLLGAPSFPAALAEKSELFHLEAPPHGGHVGFLDLQSGRQPWYERRVQEFLENLAL